MNKIPFAAHGTAYIAVYIKPKEGNIMDATDFKVDTGADMTTISKKDLVDIGFNKDWIIKNAKRKSDSVMTTATGDTVNAFYIQLPLINVLGYEARNWPLAILIEDSWDKDFKNLLGRDLLSGFNYKFNNIQDLLEIERNPTFRKRYNFLENQEINVIEI